MCIKIEKLKATSKISDKTAKKTGSHEKKKKVNLLSFQGFKFQDLINLIRSLTGSKII